VAGVSAREVNEFFAGEPLAKELFMVVSRAVEAVGDAAVRVTKSQIAFRRHGTFAAVWLPGRYLRGASAPLVLTVFLPFRDGSPRWKQVVEPAPGRFTHHLEVWRAADIDEEVEGWLRSAWDAAA
jgi:Domain of unknown function (DUF5655)